MSNNTTPQTKSDVFSCLQKLTMDPKKAAEHKKGILYVIDEFDASHLELGLLYIMAAMFDNKEMLKALTEGMSRKLA